MRAFTSQFSAASFQQSANLLPTTRCLLWALGGRRCGSTCARWQPLLCAICDIKQITCHESNSGCRVTCTRPCLASEPGSAIFVLSVACGQFLVLMFLHQTVYVVVQLACVNLKLPPSTRLHDCLATQSKVQQFIASRLAHFARTPDVQLKTHAPFMFRRNPQ
jgi:hypothetical protein